MTKISDPAQYSGGGAGCTAAAFIADSWIPSTRGSRFPCKVSAPAATFSQCNTAAPNDIATTTGTCKGCMDTAKIIYQVPATNAQITGRYSCATWTTDFTGVFTNYYDRKRTVVGPVKGRSDGTKTSYNTPTTGYKARINAIQTSFDSIINTLSSTVNSVVDPNRGLVAGLNCQLLG